MNKEVLEEIEATFAEDWFNDNETNPTFADAIEWALRHYGHLRAKFNLEEI